jgi:hypothetical protein
VGPLAPPPDKALGTVNLVQATRIIPNTIRANFRESTRKLYSQTIAQWGPFDMEIRRFTDRTHGIARNSPSHYVSEARRTGVKTSWSPPPSRAPDQVDLSACEELLKTRASHYPSPLSC